MTRRRRLLLAAAVLAGAGLAAGLSLALRGGGSRETTFAAATAGATGFALLFEQAQVGAKESKVLARWPKIPYQHYSDNLRDDCYEWQGVNLYNLCFKDGVLRSKSVF